MDMVKSKNMIINVSETLQMHGVQKENEPVYKNWCVKENVYRSDFLLPLRMSQCDVRMSLTFLENELL